MAVAQIGVDRIEQFHIDDQVGFHSRIAGDRNGRELDGFARAENHPPCELSDISVGGRPVVHGHGLRSRLAQRDPECHRRDAGIALDDPGVFDIDDRTDDCGVGNRSRRCRGTGLGAGDVGDIETKRFFAFRKTVCQRRDEDIGLSLPLRNRDARRRQRRIIHAAGRGAIGSGHIEGHAPRPGGLIEHDRKMQRIAFGGHGIVDGDSSWDAVVVENGAHALPVADGRADGVQQGHEKCLIGFDGVVAEDHDLDAGQPGAFIDSAAIKETTVVVGRIRAAVGRREFESDPAGRGRLIQANVEKDRGETGIAFRHRNVVDRQYGLRRRLYGQQRGHPQQQHRARIRPERPPPRRQRESGNDARTGRMNNGLTLHCDTPAVAGSQPGRSVHAFATIPELSA